MYLRFLFRILPLFFLGGCALKPTVDVVLVDRHTVMESEAAGEWPQMEQRLEKGPVALRDVNDSLRRERAFRVLDGEYPSDTNRTLE